MRLSDALDGRVAVVTGALGELGPHCWVRRRLAERRRDASSGSTSSRRARRRPGRARRSTARHHRPRRRRRGRAQRDRRRSGRDGARQQRRHRPAARRRGREPVAIEDVPLEDFDATLEVNLLGTFNVIQVFGARDARRAAAARSSTSARSTRRVAPDPRFYDHMPRRPAVPQAAGLRRLEGGRRQPDALLRAALGPAGVRVNTLSPGGVARRPGRGVRAQVQRPRAARPDGGAGDLAGPLVFLASDASRYVTGHELRVDGGFTA